MSRPQGQEDTRVKREDSPEVMEANSQEYAGNPHQAVAKILNDERIGGLEEKTFREVEKYVSALLLNGQAQTLSSFGCLLDSKISLVSYVRFLENAALPYLDGRSDEQAKVQAPVKREDQRESSSGETPIAEGLNDFQKKVISEAQAKMSPLPENMGSYDTWIRIMRALLRLEDESLWTNDTERVRGVLDLTRRIVSQSKGFTADRREKFLRYAISAVKLPMKTFWTGLHASITYETPFTVKWCNLRMYGGWPGFDRLELRMNSIARVSFGVNGWPVIKDLKPFLHILCAMTPAPIWKRLMDMGIEDAKDYLEKCIGIRDHPLFADKAPHNYAEVLKYTFGVPRPEEVDKVGMGTIAINPTVKLSPERDSFVHNPVLLSSKHPRPRFHQCLDLMLCDEVNEQLELNRHRGGQPVDIYSKWETLRVRGGWPGFTRLSYRMDVIAREMFGASEWKDLNIHPAFLHVLAAMTPTPLWAYMTRYMSFDDAKGYYKAVMSLKEQLFAQPLVMKHMFGVPLPFESDRLGFGTHYINPSRNVGPEFLANPVFHVCEDIKPRIPSQMGQLLVTGLMKYAAGIAPIPSNLPQPSLMEQLPCPENATIEIPLPSSSNGVSQRPVIPPNDFRRPSKDPAAAQHVQASASQQSFQNTTLEIQRPNSQPAQKQPPHDQASNSLSSSQRSAPLPQRPDSQPIQQARQCPPSNNSQSFSQNSTSHRQPADSLPSFQGDAVIQGQPCNSNPPSQDVLTTRQSASALELQSGFSTRTPSEAAQSTKTQQSNGRKEETLKSLISENNKELSEARKAEEEPSRNTQENEGGRKREEKERKQRGDEGRKKSKEEENRVREEVGKKKTAEEERRQREGGSKQDQATLDEKRRADEEAYVEAGKRLTEIEFQKKQHNRNKNSTNDTNKPPHPPKKLGDMPPLENEHPHSSQSHPQRRLGDMPPLGQGQPQQQQGKSNQHQHRPYNYNPPPWHQRPENNYRQQQHTVPPWEHHRKQTAPSHHQLGRHPLGVYQNQNQRNKEYYPVNDLSNSSARSNNQSQAPARHSAPGKPNEPGREGQQQSSTSLAARLGLPKRPRNEWDSFVPEKRSKNS